MGCVERLSDSIGMLRAVRNEDASPGVAVGFTQADDLWAQHIDGRISDSGGHRDRAREPQLESADLLKELCSNRFGASVEAVENNGYTYVGLSGTAGQREKGFDTERRR